MSLSSVIDPLRPAGDWCVRHSRALSTGFAFVLGGVALTAFGVAPLLPDPADLPRQKVVDLVAPPDDLRSQLDALAEHPLELWRSDLTRSSDSLDSLFRRLGINDAEAAAFVRRDPHARRLVDGRAGKLVQARTAADGSLKELVARYGAGDPSQRRFTRLTLTRNDGQWSSRVEIGTLAGQALLASGTIRNTLFAATDEARLPDAVAAQVAEIFAADIDFHRELNRGDTFSVVYEALVADGEPVTWEPSSGRVLSAEFVNRGRTHQAMWFADASGRGAYYSFDGQSKRRAFLASPMEFSRVTSGFSVRFHPLLQTMRAHRGVDYSAPTGTPVRVVGHGVVEFAGRMSGYGNVVEVRHDKQRSTLYAHLSRVDVRSGQALEQGQLIGAVGATGWATGPHLHYEFRVNGAHVDPAVAAGRAEPLVLDGAARARFADQSRGAQAQLDLAETVASSSARFE